MNNSALRVGHERRAYFPASPAPIPAQLPQPEVLALPHIKRSLNFCKALMFLPRRSPSKSSSMANSSEPVAPIDRRPRLRGVVFDMDGTLIVPAMYRAVLGEQEYVALKAQRPSGIDILHHIENLSPENQRRAYETIADFERQGMDRLQIMPGALELCKFLDSKKIRRGLITRNAKVAVDFFHRRFGLMFYPALSREFVPYKPDPAPLLHICSTWEVLPDEVMMVGDSLKDDVVCGKRAGVFTCLLDEKGKYGPEFSDPNMKPDFKVASLAHVHSLLEANFDLFPLSIPD